MELPQQQFACLLSLVLDGSCTEDDREELAQLIVEHPGFEAELVDALSIHSLLQWQFDDVTRVELNLGLPDEGDVRVLPTAEAPAHLAIRSAAYFRSRWTWSAAALLMCAFGAMWWRGGQGDGANAIATIVAVEGVQWSDNSTALQANNHVGSGRLQSSAGSFTLKFRSGPTVRFMGPSTVDVESDMLIALERGRATADVPDSGIGFTIKTANVHVVDQGTQFGVAAEGGATDVIVFEGKVDLQNQIRTAAPQQRLVRGEAVSVDATGAVNRIMQIGQNAEGDWWTTDRADADSTIEEVRDNVPVGIGTSYSCFQIAFQGLKDDEFAYADHPHQWNGLSAQGLPAFLRGADLVRTFNDYRYMPELEMVVTFRVPANLYVFFDDRVPTPEWLETEFEDTGVDIGLDEGMHELVPDHVVAIGGGNSIDNVFSVWRRRCVDGAPVRLGPVGPTNEARAMYGVAATPLEL